MKRVLITGVSGGMGEAAAAAAHDAGWSVTGLDVRECTAEGVDFIKCDLTDSASVEASFATVSDRGEKYDAVVHMAGIYDLDSLVEMDEERFMRIFGVNLFSVYRINRTFLPLLNEGARIVITTSELAPLDPLPFTGIYGITKSALDKYAHSLRTELSLIGHPVSVIRPGAVDTGLLSDSVKCLDRFTKTTKLYSYNAENFRRVVDSVEAKCVKPERIAKVVMKALCAKRPRYVYNVNRNPLLLIMNALPDRLQSTVIRQILK